MYELHPSARLRAAFAARPFQGAVPEEARYVFVGLDANYAADIERGPIFEAMLAYLAEGPAFWRRTGVHHPFLLPAYGSGDGARYHRNFASLGFGPQQADQVSFYELLHVPTVGRSRLAPGDLDRGHLERLSRLVIDGAARYVFMPDGVARLLRTSGAAGWLPKEPRRGSGALGVWHESRSATVICHYHLSVYGHQEATKRAQIEEIRALIAADASRGKTAEPGPCSSFCVR